MKGDTMVLIEGINVNDLPDDDDFVAGNSGNDSANYIDLASLEGDVAAFMNSPDDTVSTAELKDNKENPKKKSKQSDPTAMDNVLFGDGNAESEAKDTKDTKDTNPKTPKGSRKKKDAESASAGGTGTPAKKKRGGKRAKPTENTGNSGTQVEEAGAGNSGTQVEEAKKAKKAKGKATVKKRAKGRVRKKIHSKKFLLWSLLKKTRSLKLLMIRKTIRVMVARITLLPLTCRSMTY